MELRHIVFAYVLSAAAIGIGIIGSSNQWVGLGFLASAGVALIWLVLTWSSVKRALANFRDDNPDLVVKIRAVVSVGLVAALVAVVWLMVRDAPSPAYERYRLPGDSRYLDIYEGELETPPNRYAVSTPITLSPGREGIVIEFGVYEHIIDGTQIIIDLGANYDSVKRRFGHPFRPLPLNLFQGTMTLGSEERIPPIFKQSFRWPISPTQSFYPI